MPSEEQPRELSERLPDEHPQNTTHAVRPSPSEGHGHGEDLSFVQKFLISYNTMDVRLRVLTGIVFAEVISDVFLIGAKDSHFLSTSKFTFTGGAARYSYCRG